MTNGRVMVEPDFPALVAADPDGLYLAALDPYPYLMTPAQVAETD